MIKTKPNEIWSEYIKGTEYLSQNDLYETVKTNENFYIGKQWEGIKSENMPKPVINQIQRCVKHLVSTISSNEVSISIDAMSKYSDDNDRMAFISDEVERIIEQAKIKEAARLCVRNSAVDGAAYMLQTFDSEFDTGQDMKGTIENTIIDNTNVYFGNPYSNDIQKQPYIIIALRQHISIVKEEARELGIDEDSINDIHADNDGTQANDDSTDLVTVLLKFYRVNRIEKKIIEEMDLDGNIVEIEDERRVSSIHFTKCTKNLTLIEPTDLGYTRYPLSCFGWESIKNSYLYTSPVTSQIVNQVFVNKTYAIAQMYGLQSAFPKVLYDKNKTNIDELLNSTSPNAVASLDIAGKFMDFIKVPDFSNNILQLGQETISLMKDTMGVTEADLGNVRADNTSAIIALQEASNSSLEIQKQSFFSFWEDTVRNLIDMMSCTYGVRKVMHDGQMGIVDFSVLKDINYQLNVDIGSGAQFSEITQINTLDKLMQSQIITPEVYIELLPKKYILGKGKIIEDMKKKAEMQQQMSMPQNMPTNIG